ncbi:MAG: class I SAM-dependent methyltransferase [Actinobacteria bacterium]|nr:class I SAM-dependent methyltransferase [Actinomycetota bacterium]
MSSVEFWQERYRGAPVWSGRANAVLVDLAADLPPGRALDLGCGEGGDAIWLATRGWQVTAIDISSNAIDRGRAAAAAAGVPDDRIEWIACDLDDWTGSAGYDLVSAFFLQSPVALARERILRQAAASVAPGGRLLLVSHAAAPPWAGQLHAHHHDDFPTPDGELAALGLDDGWQVLIAEVRHRAATGPDGQPAELDDTVVLVQRRPTE